MRINSNAMGKGSSNRTFDIRVVLITESEGSNELTFMNFDYPEFVVLSKYFKDSKVKTRELVNSNKCDFDDESDGDVRDKSAG